MPTNNTYIPSKEELKEMGFSRSGFKKYWYLPLDVPTIYFDTHRNNRWSIFESDVIAPLVFYPRDRSHLEQIIKAFTPPIEEFEKELDDEVEELKGKDISEFINI